MRRHRRPRQARSASPEVPGADGAHSDSENSSDSEDDAEPDAPAADPGARNVPGAAALDGGLAVRTPPRRPSPPRSLERALSGSLRPSPLGDTSRAALAASAVRLGTSATLGVWRVLC